jgi:hypothetical protein
VDLKGPQVRRGTVCALYNSIVAFVKLRYRFELRSHVRKLGRKPTTAQKLELVKKRRGLKTRITSFTKTAVQFLGEDTVDTIYETERIVMDEDVSEDEEQDQQNPALSAADPERQMLPFPSAMSDDCLKELPQDRLPIIEHLMDTELAIREGHGEDALDQVRTALIHLSWQFKNTVRRATSVVQKTRAWDKIKLLNRTWKLQRHVYNQNRAAMVIIGPPDVAEKHPFLDIHDCSVSTTVTNPNSAGQSRNRLPWLWGSSSQAPGFAAPESDEEIECKVCTSPDIYFTQVTLQSIESIGCVRELKTIAGMKSSL